MIEVSISLHSVMVVQTQRKYKGKWGVMKPASSVFVEYRVDEENLFIDLNLSMSPDDAFSLGTLLHNKGNLPATEQNVQSEVRLILRNEVKARACVNSFRQSLLPVLRESDYKKHFEVESFYCGAISVPVIQEDARNHYDDSKELMKQYVVLSDGRVIIACVWGESGETYLSYIIPADDLECDDKGALMKYLAEVGCKVFEDQNQYAWEFSRRGGGDGSLKEYVLQTVMNR